MTSWGDALTHPGICGRPTMDHSALRTRERRHLYVGRTVKNDSLGIQSRLNRMTGGDATDQNIWHMLPPLKMPGSLSLRTAIREDSMKYLGYALTFLVAFSVSFGPGLVKFIG